MAAEPMSGYGLIAAVVQSLTSLAWPAAFVFALCLFRQELKELLPLFRVKYKDLEISLKQAEKDAAQLAVEGQQRLATPEELRRVIQLAESSPREAIESLHWELEDALRQAAARLRVLEPERISMLTLIRILRSIGAIDQPTSDLLEKLRKLGHAAVLYSENSISVSDEFRYRTLANQAIDRLNAIPAKK